MQVKETHSKLIKTGLWQAGFLLLTPFTAVWLMQFTYGALPWSMSLGPTLANALCVALLFWPLCALVRRIAHCCIGIHIAAGLWGAANYFVNSFRGTPILPWDFSALSTAADVAGNYRFVPTWQGPSAPDREAVAPAAVMPGGGASVPDTDPSHPKAGALFGENRRVGPGGFLPDGGLPGGLPA